MLDSKQVWSGLWTVAKAKTIKRPPKEREWGGVPRGLWRGNPAIAAAGRGGNQSIPPHSLYPLNGKAVASRLLTCGNG